MRHIGHSTVLGPDRMAVIAMRSQPRAILNSVPLHDLSTMPPQFFDTRLSAADVVAREDLMRGPIVEAIEVTRRIYQAAVPLSFR